MARLTGIQRIMEVGMIISCVFAFFLLLAMASFHPADPGWSQAGLQSDVNNWVGPIGAWFADILFFTLGSFAYSLPNEDKYTKSDRDVTSYIHSAGAP